MKRNILPKEREVLLDKILPHRQFPYNLVADDLNKLADFIIQNNLPEPSIYLESYCDCEDEYEVSVYWGNDNISVSLGLDWEYPTWGLLIIDKTKKEKVHYNSLDFNNLLPIEAIKALKYN